MSKLIGYDFEIRYRPDKLNNVADALSRENKASLMAFSHPIFRIVQDIRAASAHDSSLINIQAAVQEVYPDYTERDGLLLFRGKILVPNEATLRSLLLREFHSSVVGGHAGITRTFQRLATNFYWSGMRKAVR